MWWGGECSIFVSLAPVDRQHHKSMYHTSQKKSQKGAFALGEMTHNCRKAMKDISTFNEVRFLLGELQYWSHEFFFLQFRIEIFIPLFLCCWSFPFVQVFSVAQWHPLVLIDSLALSVSLFPAMASGFAADLADVAHAKPSEVDLGALPASTYNILQRSWMSICHHQLWDWLHFTQCSADLCDVILILSHYISRIIIDRVLITIKQHFSTHGVDLSGIPALTEQLTG